MIARIEVPFAAGWLWMGFFFCLAVLGALCWEEIDRRQCLGRNGWAVLVLTAACLVLAFASFLTIPEGVEPAMALAGLIEEGIQ